MINIGTEQAKAGTVIPGGSITSNTTWKWEDSPFWVQDNLILEEGVTLTIEPGVTVKFTKKLAIHLEVKGNLIAVGTPSLMINFTSNASSPASKDWGNIWVYSTGKASLEYINVTYGNLAVFLFYASNVNVTNSTFMFNEFGILLNHATNNNIMGNLFLQNKISNIKLEDSENNTFTNNNITLSDQYGLYSQNSINNKIYHNNFIDNWNPQAGDDLNGNFWNDSYPSGGNYWSDWSPITPDLYDGAITPQTTGLPDGICDNPYYIDADSVDYYPLKYPFGSPSPDNEPPTIKDINITPDPQEIYDFVNISALVADNEQVGGIWINITDPNSATVGNFSMNYNVTYDRFYRNATYSILGTYQFTIFTNDTSDNWNFTSGSFTIEDLTPPLINNVASNPNIQDVFGNVNVSAIVIDNYNLFDVWVNISLPNGSSTKTTMNQTLGNVFYLNQSYDELGVYDFTIWANDTSDNWNSSSGFFEIRDSTPPSIDAVVTNPSTQEVFGNVNVSTVVIDNFDLYGVWINISKPDGSSINTTMNETVGNVFYFNRSYNQVGVYDFFIWANDTSDNWNFTSGSFTIEDPTPPVVNSVASNPDIQEVFGYVNISATISDNYDFYGVWVNISLPNGSWANITMNKALGNVFYLNQTYDLGGIYDFIIWANDTSNNWNFSSANFTIGDFTPPSISDIISNPDTQEIFKKVNISAIVTDNFELSSIWVNITKPDHSSINITMNDASINTFYLNQSYDQLGVYNFTIWANDTSNNWNSASGFFSIKDLGIPQATADILPPYWKNLLTFEIAWTALDDLGLSNITLLYRYSADNSFWSSWVEYSYNNTVSGTSASGSFQFIAPADGYYEFFANASDIGNNWEPNASIAEAMAAVDIASPLSNINAISSYWVNSPSLTFYASATDGLSGVKEVTLWYRFSNDNVSWGLWEIFETDEVEPWSWIFGFPKGEGYYEFYCIGKDDTNNVESKSLGEVICAHDITPPTAYAGEDQVVGPSTTINFNGASSSDNFGVIDNYTWTITKGSVFIAVLYGSNPVFNFDDVGDYTVTLTVKDPSGNADDDTMIVEVVVEFVDSEAPTITHSAVPTTQEVYGIVNITAVVTDNVGVFDVWVQIFDPENNELENVSMNRIGLTDNYWYENIYSIVGIYNYTVWANDTSDNWALVNGSFVIQDSTPPIANAGEDQGIDLSDSLHFDGSDSTDNVGIINYTWNITKNDNSIITLYGINPSYRFDERGNYDVTLTVRDAAGNTDSDTVTVTVSSPKVQEGPNYWWLILLIIILIIVVIMFFLLARRKKKEPEESTPETSIQPDQTPVSPPPIPQEEEAKEHDSE